MHVSDYDATSERLSEDAYQSSAADYLIYLFHIATYEFARSYVTDKVVLDFGCGTGYGTHRLADSASHITGIDVAPGAVAFARDRYVPQAESAGDWLEYAHIDPVELSPLPFPDNHFDTVLSFQVIEHVPSVANYLSEIRRVLRPGGTFICATPDRRWRLFPRQRPFNVFHLEEWGPQELGQLLAPVFDTTSVFGMTAPDEVINIELRRCRKTRVLTYPFTFPGAPERWRSWGLKRMKGMSERTDGDAAGPAKTFDFDLSDIRIAPEMSPSANIITVSS
jgi:SAM-dependent methyltransferase